MHTRAKRADVAREAGVAESTVTRAMNNSPLISPEVRAKVHDAAARLGYVPNHQAASLKLNRSYHMGFVVRSYDSFPPFSRAYFPSLLDGVVLGAEERGYMVSIILDREHEDAQPLWDAVRSRLVDGLVVSVTTRNDDRFEFLKTKGIPFVLVNNFQKRMHCIDCRPEPGMRKAFEHAVELGHKSIGYVTGDLRFLNATDRFEAFKSLSREFDRRSAVSRGDFSRRSGYQGAKSLLESTTPPTLIMTASDRCAIGVLDYCREHQISIPTGISVIGYDNMYPALDTVPPLTTVDNPVAETGRQAAYLMVDIIEKTVKRASVRYLDTGFVVRQSTGPYKK